MMQQLSFSPVENILTVLFAAAILGYLLYLLVRSLRNRQRGYHTVNRAKVYSKAQATAVNQPVYLANGTVNSGVTEAENVKTVIFENLEKEGVGIGSCYIGDVIENAEQMREALCLPEYVAPACMLVFGRPTDQQKIRPKPARFAKDAVVCENTYRDRTDDELRADFTARAAANGQQNYDFTTAIQAFCKRKYESDFSREMTRSAEVYLEDFRK